MDVRCVVRADDRLGGGPVWSARDGRLYWFDISGKRLAWYEPATDARGGFDLPFRASAAAVRAAGGLLMATDAGLADCDPEAGTLEIVQAIRFEPGLRTGDGHVDPAGTFWWSTVGEGEGDGQRPGSVMRTPPDLSTQVVLTGIQAPNSIAFSPDGKRILVADSTLQTIFAHEMQDLTKISPFAHTRGEIAKPWGSAVDAQGYVWNAQWDAWRIVRYAPDGRIERTIPIAVQRPTGCAFGGADLTTLYVTSASEGLSMEARRLQPLAGGLFAIETGVRGLALPAFTS